MCRPLYPKNIHCHFSVSLNPQWTCPGLELSGKTVKVLLINYQIFIFESWYWTHRNKNIQMAQRNHLVSLGEEKHLCHQGKESVILCSFQKGVHTFSYWFYFLFSSKIVRRGSEHSWQWAKMLKNICQDISEFHLSPRDFRADTLTAPYIRHTPWERACRQPITNK